MTEQPDPDRTLDETTDGDRKSPSSAGQETRGDTVGPWTLISPLGEGGFGSVWVAERRRPFTQRVALKLIKPGMDSKAVVARFEQERQALAVMNHPGIAKVVDGGLTERGRPYFAMELVKGDEITAFCDARRLGLEDRLRLFIQACEAVQHAHLKGLVHRDIKPSNILAFETEGGDFRLKVIDFGVAKAMSQPLTEKTIFTQTGHMIGTPEYMSPEQADPSSTDIDTRSDVYSLGVLLYEMIVGVTPFDGRDLRSKAYAELQRVLREQDPPRPSDRLSTISQADANLSSRIETSRQVKIAELARTLRSELEWIPMMAMRKEPQRRYQSAMALADDLRNYLDRKPLVAAPESRTYRVRKYAARHKALVTGTTAVAASLVAGLTLATWQWRVAVDNAEEATRQKAIAETRTAEAIAARENEAAERARADERAAAAEAAELRERERSEQLAKVSEFQAGMLSGIDTTTAGVQLMADIRRRLDEALAKAGIPEEERAARLEAFRRDLVRVNATDTATSMIDRTILIPAIEEIDRRFQDDPATDASLRQALADLYRSIGLFDAAFPLQETSLATRRRVLGEEHPDTLVSINNMGFLLRSRGKFTEAESYYHEALEKRRRVLGEEHPDTLNSIANMGAVLQFQGELTEAEPYYREALERRRRGLGEEHPDTLISIGNMGGLLRAQGKFTEAEPYYREALEKCRRVLGEEHPLTLTSITNMGALLWSQGKFAETEPYIREALEKRRRVLGEEHPDTLKAIRNMGVLLSSLGKTTEAESHYREHLEKCRRVLGEDHPDTLKSIRNISILLLNQGKLTEAEPYFREALEKSRQVLGEDHPDTFKSIGDMGVLLRNQGRLAEAEPYYREVLQKRRRVLGEEHPDTLTSINSLGTLLWSQDKLAGAESYYREAMEKRRRVLGEEHPDTLASISSLGTLLLLQGKLTGAEPYIREALEKRRRVLGEEHPMTLISVISLGNVLVAREQYLDAVELLRPVEPAARTAFRGDNAPRLASLLFPLGNATRGLSDEPEQYALAERYLDEALEIYTSAAGQRKAAEKAASSLAELHTAWDRIEPGTGHDAEAARFRAMFEDPESPPE